MSAARKLDHSGVLIFDLDQTLARPETPSCVGVTEQMDSDRLLHLAVTQPMFHIVQRQGFAYDREVESARLMVEDPRVLRENPACAILSPFDVSESRERAATILDMPFTSSREKRAVMDRVNDVLADRPRSLVDDVLSVTDELFTNAIYNAPFVDFATGANPGISRTDPTEIRYADGLTARMLLASDEQRLVVGCIDPFGSLNLPRYLFRIKETYVRGAAATMNFGPGGAGLGSYIIFNAGSSAFFGVWPGRATVLFCVIPLGLSLRKRTALPKHLHWFQG